MTDPSNVVAYRPKQTGEESTQYFGMIIFLCAWAMLFCGLLMAYGVIRMSTPAWPPAGVPRVPIALPGVGTALVLLSGGAVHWAVTGLRAGARGRCVQGLALALALAGMFLALEAAVWTSLVARGLTLVTGVYGGFFYVMTGFHALQLGVGMCAMTVLLARVWGGLVNPARMQSLRLWGMYWQSVAAIGLIIYVAVYVA